MTIKEILLTKRLGILYLLALLACHGFSQQGIKRLPIIDVHVHAMKLNPDFASGLCPWFLKNMPGADPNQQAPSFFNSDCVDLLKPTGSDQEMQEALFEAAERLNVIMVAGGDAEILHRWHDAAPDRIIPSLSISRPVL